MRKRILIIANAFPPTGGAGVQRPAKFAKFLARMGHKPIVWSAGYVPYLPVDETLLDDLPPEVDRRTMPMIHAGRVADAVLSPFAILTRRRGRMSRWHEALRSRIETWIRRAMWLRGEGETDWWARRSYRHVRAILDEERIDVVFSTYSPAANHWLAMHLKRATGCAWVADFRDLWTDDPRYKVESAGRRRGDRTLEQRFLTEADAVVGVSESQTRILSDHVPGRRDRFHTITNGADLEDFERVARVRSAAARRESFTLSYVGQFRETSVCDQYLTGIAQFLGTDANRRARFRFRVVGQMSPRLERRAVELNVNLSTTGYVSHLDAVREMCVADLLLLSTARGRNGTSIIPGKVFEYLASGRPILAIGDPESEVIRFIETMKAGVGVPRDATAVAEALARYWNNWRSGRALTGAGTDAVASYSRETLTAKLAGVFELAIESARIDHRESERFGARGPTHVRPVALGTGAVEA